MQKAVAYYRTSSAANVGNDKDSKKRQQEAIEGFAKANGYDVIEGFYDAAVSGADPIEARPGFGEMLAYLRSNGARIILVENASRFARDHIVQGLGHKLLQGEGFDLIPVDAPEYFTEDTPTANLIRQILGVISEFDKAVTVQKLRGARDRKSKEIGRRVEGRKSYRETEPEMVREAKRLGRKNPKTGRVRSLRQIAKELASIGYYRDNGQPYNAQTIKNILAV